MANQYKNKIIYNDAVLMDLTGDTVSAATLLQGETAHDRSGAPITGTYVPFTPTGNINITQAGVTDVTNYATATVPVADPWVGIEDGFFTDSGVRKYRYKGAVVVEVGEGDTAGYISDGYIKQSEWEVRDAIPANTTITPTTSAQTIGGAMTMMEGPVTVAAMPSGTAGTPTATKGTVSNNSISVTPSVTNTTGYITGGTKTGTAVTVSASELVNGTYSVNSSGTKDVTNFASASVPAATYNDSIMIPGANFEIIQDASEIQVQSTGEIGAFFTIAGNLSNVVDQSGFINSSDKLRLNIYATLNDQLSTQAATTITPTESSQTAVAAGKYTTGAVTVSAIPSNYVGSGITRRTASDVSNVSWAYETNGTNHYITHTITPSIGYYASEGNKGFTQQIQSITNIPKQAATTITPTESSQTAANANQWLTGAITVSAIPSNYIGSGITQRDQTDLTASGATVTVPAGYYAEQQTKTISTGTATAPASISGSSATVSTGTNTLTLTKSVSVTPSVTAGYIASGTTGNANVSLTASVTTKAAATITPGTSNQTIASGTYLTGTQTISGDADLVAGNIKTGVNIFGVAGSYTSDATAAAADILDGETAYVNGSKITGTLEVQNFYTGSSAPSASLGSVGDLYLQT